MSRHVSRLLPGGKRKLARDLPKQGIGSSYKTYVSDKSGKKRLTIGPKNTWTCWVGIGAVRRGLAPGEQKFKKTLDGEEGKMGCLPKTSIVPIQMGLGVKGWRAGERNS